MRTIRIGGGAGFSEDDLEPALDLMKYGDIDYICFECLAERTIAIAQQQKLANPRKGYNAGLEFRMEHVLPLAREKGIKVITNMGAANVERAMEVTMEIAARLGLTGLKVAGVMGDDVFDKLDRYKDIPIFETGERFGGFKKPLVSANAYLGFEGIAEALDNGADVVITGRCADAALFLGPLVHEFGWNTYEMYGKGTLVGHLMECSSYLTGGYFCIPGKSDVEDFWNIGFPIAEVSEDGTFFVTKLDRAGGRVDVQTCTEQLLYEIHDPASYLTPNCVADFSGVRFEEVAKNRVKVTGATGRPATGKYKVSVGYKDSYVGISELGLCGLRWKERCDLYFEAAEKRWQAYGEKPEEHQFSIIGYNSICRDAEHMNFDLTQIPEVRARIAVRADSMQRVKRQIELANPPLSCPAGASILTANFKEVLAILSLLIPCTDVNIRVFYREV
ncbi:acyclic terpene utilization AtuA family protein [Papillibacter cinnamivorans]|uniref:Acyclic terpene utilisation N-terminal domain-containing protein n=1 Tax=Papillibacter cinnamivorans DSM 12816 TaxID=1122930 RepID=A0A1W2A406_9FIRM|nr:acyclic terpene utilization AtuA family protein [Papillibacter cinnamivorans]SMC55404.1 Protein of unknown function [Papillibacter cinnamivorans DSM 12816]